MTGEEWQKALIASPRILDPEDAHEIQVSCILTTLSLERAAAKLDEIINGW